jgi:aspartate racemase
MAFEVAQQLHAQDQKVALLALFDYVPRKSDDCESRNSWKLDSFIYFLWNLVYLLKDFLQSPLSEQFDRIQTRIKLLIKKISNNSELNSPNTNALIPSIEQTINHVLSKVPEDIHEEYRKSLEAQGRSFIDYVPQLYSGRVALFLSRRWSFWRFLKNKIAATEVTLKVISAGNHATILQEPYAQVLAEQLRDCLDKAQADSSDQKSNILVWESEILSVK